MDVWEDDRHPVDGGEKAAIRRWVRRARPALPRASASGHQLLADALGGEVGPDGRCPRSAWCAIELTAAASDDPSFCRLPSPSSTACSGTGPRSRGCRRTAAVVLASNEHCAVQALRVGRWAWGVQFHRGGEADDTVSEWALVPAYRAHSGSARSRRRRLRSAAAVSRTCRPCGATRDTLLAAILADACRASPPVGPGAVR